MRRIFPGLLPVGSLLLVLGGLGSVPLSVVVTVAVCSLILLFVLPLLLLLLRHGIAFAVGSCIRMSSECSLSVAGTVTVGPLLFVLPWMLLLLLRHCITFDA